MDLERFGQFDAVFSNAALHWMLDPDAVATGIFKALRDGGRFVGEMGGEGNLATLRHGAARRADRARLSHAGAGSGLVCRASRDSPASIASPAFARSRAELIPRPTPLPGGAADWVKTFRAGVMDVAMVPEWERDDIAAAVEARVAPALRQPDGSCLRRLCAAALLDAEAGI